MKLTGIPYFNQADPKWGSKKLGTSTVATIKSDGCLLCCVSAVLRYHGKDSNPDRLNDDLTRVKGWYQACRLEYGAITDIYNDILVDWNNYIDCLIDPAPMDRIDEILESNRLPIVKVDYNPSTSKLDEHWVTIIGKSDDGSYLIYDPIDGTEQWFQNRYGDPKRYIFKIVVYNGPIKEEEDDENTIKDLQDKVAAQTEQILQLGTQNGVLEAELTRQEAENSRLNTSLVEARSEKATILREKKNLVGKVDNLNQKVLDLNEDKKTLRNDLATLKELSVEALTARELFGKWLKKLLRR